MIEKTYDTAFGTSVRAILAEEGMTQAQLAQALGKSSAYLNKTLTGRDRPSARWVNLVADALKLSPEQRYDLHMDAAIDHGFFKTRNQTHSTGA